MTEAEVGRLVAALTVLLGLSHALAFALDRLRQPRLIGEILAGILLGPAVLGAAAPAFQARLFGGAIPVVLSFVSWLGVLLLMFLSGSEMRRLLPAEDRRPIGWLLLVGCGLPFVAALALRPASALEGLTGAARSPLAADLILATSAAVTSIPVISRIFHDLGILGTRFARLILGAAVVEDIALWSVVTLALGLAHADASGHTFAAGARAAAFLALGLIAGPFAVRRLTAARANFLVERTPVGYLVLVLLAYAAAAGAFGSSLVFAAFLAGFGAVGGLGAPDRPRFAEALESLSRVGFGVFIPIYFAMVGYRLSLGGGLSPWLCLAYLVGSSAVKLVSVAVAARAAGFRAPLDVANLAVAANARGGPGIVIATVALDAGIISRPLFAALVVTALLTSQAAGAWLRWVLARGRPLLSEQA